MRCALPISARAAAGAIAGGTYAYGEPVRFDNPGGPGHFQWGPGGNEFLDIRSDPTQQTASSTDPGVFRQGDYYGYGSVVQAATPDGVDATFDVALYFVNPIAQGVSIPTGAPMPDGAFILSTYPGYEGTLLPEGVQTYLGMRFDVGSGYQYAWVGVVRSGQELEAFAWGYETEPGVPICAGCGGDHTGACCGPGPCQETPTQADCEAKGQGWKYAGDGTTCEEAACNNIPTVSEWGLAIMALSLLAAGTWVVRKRVPQPQPPAA